MKIQVSDSPFMADSPQERERGDSETPPAHWQAARVLRRRRGPSVQCRRRRTRRVRAGNFHRGPARGPSRLECQPRTSSAVGAFQVRRAWHTKPNRPEAVPRCVLPRRTALNPCTVRTVRLTAYSSESLTTAQMTHYCFGGSCRCAGCFWAAVGSQRRAAGLQKRAVTQATLD